MCLCVYLSGYVFFDFTLVSGSDGTKYRYLPGNQSSVCFLVFFNVSVSAIDSSRLIERTGRRLMVHTSYI